MSDLRNSNESMPDRRDGAEDRIEALLRATGPRPLVPTDRAERAKAVVRAHWRVEVGRRSRRRWVWTAAAVATAAILLVAVGIGLLQSPAFSPADASIAQVERVSRSAWSRTAKSTPAIPAAALSPGDPVAVGSEITTGEDGRLSMRMASGHSLRLDVDTRIRLLSDRTFALDRGAIYVDSRGPWGSADQPVEIRTSFGSIRDVGTRFEVRLGSDTLQVRVRDGVVSLAGATESVELTAGRGLRVDREGRMESLEPGPFDEDWAWIDDVTPMMRIEGRSLREFLDWIAHERGLRLQFAGPELDAATASITLNGSIEGMTLDQALESVLPTCRMTHRLERDLLWVAPLAGPRTSN